MATLTKKKRKSAISTREPCALQELGNIKMGGKKKRTEEQIKKAKKEAEKRRRARIKADPIKHAEHKAKEKARRQKRKEDNKTKTIADLTPRDQRMQRAKWREAQRKKRALEKINVRLIERLRAETPISESGESDVNSNEVIEPVLAPLADPSSPTSSRGCPSPSSSMSSSSVSRQKAIGLKMARQNRTAKETLIEQQKQTIEVLKKKIHALTMKNYRLQNTKDKRTPLSPNLIKFKQDRIDVQRFLSRDDNSKLCPGKKDTITRHGKKKQKRYLNDTLENLHKKYVSESKKKISYPTFTRFRPFWIVKPKITERDTCLCAIHENFNLVHAKLKELNLIKEKTADDVCDTLVCSTNNFNCMTRKCHKCAHKVLNFLTFDNSETIEYKQWMTKKEIRSIKGKDKEITRTVKDSIMCTKKDLIEKFLGMLPKFLKHKYNIKQQYQATSQLKKQLRPGDALVHIDFSENYQCKYAAETQSVHFGASRQQLSLHTCVLYYLIDESDGIKTLSFCSVSDCLRHDAVAIYAHLKKSLKQLICDKNLSIRTLHILSDGPSTQYKNKTNLYLFTQNLVHYLGIKAASWNFSEAGHGKGAADGVGAVVKRTADSIVSHGEDIPDYKTFVTKLVCRTNIHLYTVRETDITEADLLVPKTLQTIPGTSLLHQVTWTADQPEKIFLRELSCTECSLTDLCPHFPVGKGCFVYSTTNANRARRSLTIESRESVEPQANHEKKTDESPKIGSWVVVQFEGKKTTSHFAGQVLSTENNEELLYVVKFLRRKDLTKGIFVWQEPEDISLVTETDILCVLPEPTPTRRGEIMFKYDFYANKFTIK